MIWKYFGTILDCGINLNINKSKRRRKHQRLRNNLKVFLNYCLYLFGTRISNEYISDQETAFKSKQEIFIEFFGLNYISELCKTVL